MSKFSKVSSAPNEQSLNFIIPIVVLLLIGMLYVMTQRADTHFANFVLIGAGAITAIYWISVIKKMAKQVVVPKFNAREAEAKNWVYDLIKGEDEIVFVAEVPGPDDKIMVRLIDGILYVRGSSRFSKEIPIEGSSQMQITDFKYRNGVLTLKIS
uniref:Hsp20/alpha crystallin family protein n=1 Tax=uncultured marine thaumarchaeote AD1000_69_E02 TaxID=1455932 RepID=A0A075G1I3_9ARCH|nr:hypothetical protein [uncultured marine thaumarchaeote AD1000_69_E02]